MTEASRPAILIALACVLNAAGIASAARSGYHPGGFTRHSASPRYSYSASARYPVFPRAGSFVPRAYARDGGWQAPRREDRRWPDYRNYSERARPDAVRWRDDRQYARSDYAHPDAARSRAAQQPAPVMNPAAGPGAITMAPGASPADSAASLASGLLGDLLSSYVGAGSGNEMSSQEPMDDYADADRGDYPDQAQPIIGLDYR